MAEKRRMRKARGRALGRLIPMQFALVLLWLFLWGGFSWTTLLTGLVASSLIPFVFYLPPIEITGRVHVGWLAWFVLRLFIDIARASGIVAAQAFGIGYSRDAAVIAVPLRTRSDVIMTATAEASTLVPGTLVLDIDRESRELYLHVFSVRSLDDVEKARREVRETEARIILAIGSPWEARVVRRERREARAARLLGALGSEAK